MSKQCNLSFWYFSNKFFDTNWKYCSKKPRNTVICDNKQDSWAKITDFTEVTPTVLLIKLLQSMWKLSVTKPNIISHSLPVSSRLEMNGFTFMKTPLQSRPNFSYENIRENLNNVFIRQVTYERKLIRHWTVY